MRVVVFGRENDAYFEEAKQLVKKATMVGIAILGTTLEMGSVSIISRRCCFCNSLFAMIISSFLSISH